MTAPQIKSTTTRFDATPLPEVQLEPTRSRESSNHRSDPTNSTGDDRYRAAAELNSNESH